MSDEKTTRMQSADRSAKRKKLTLSSETLRDLSVQDTNEVKGGLSLKVPNARGRGWKPTSPNSGQC
jgi:hypothetical protein